MASDTLKGLIETTPDTIAALSEEEAKQTLMDIRDICAKKGILSGVARMSHVTIAEMPHYDVVEAILDIRDLVTNQPIISLAGR